ncbi:hypothetical protein TELCIR_03520 [Teladorsagia circumcincta]|uniref:Uncharacterized protein n=1 Tax=Teladorsagia circumcincta TaxID=45464 RepID=A0A2G9UY98_TELCI|nr:hypothetical protein TELCIR_03520 [Teladorsagia circumcincta]
MSAQVHVDDAVAEEERGEKVVLTEMILVPVDRYPRSGTRRERSNDTEPLHVLIQCEDYEKKAHQKMRNAVEAINQLLHPPPEGKDELKRKQLIELSIINGTYRPTSATKVALQAPRPASAAHLPSMMENSTYSEQARLLSQFAEAAKHGKTNEVEEQYAALAQMLGTLNPVQPSNVNCNYYDYYKNLLSCTLADPGFLSTLMQSLDLYGMGNRPAMHPGAQHHHHMLGQSVSSPGQIPQANLHQYLTAAAMLNSAPFSNDGSGDGPKNKIRNSA